MSKHLLSLLLSFICLAAKANPDSLISYLHHAMLFNEVMPQEKVYLHLDNNWYFAGDTIWYKAYTVRADNNRPSPLSRILHVELHTL